LKSPLLTRVRPPRHWNGIDLREIWEYRELLDVLIRRDLTLRYKQTLVGMLWVLGQPILTTLVLSFVLTRLNGKPQGGVPYPLFVYAALVPWAYFSHALTKLTVCFIEQWELVARVYAPRLLIPLGTSLAAMVDFAVTFLVLPVLMIIYHVAPSWRLIALPAVMVLLLTATLGIGLWLASLNAEYRDTAFALPFVLQIGLFVTPMFYSSEVIPLPWRALYALNPMVGVVEGMRWTILNTHLSDPLTIFAASTFSSLVVLASGLYVFQRREPYLADII
jgi:lipopolysaccharide transport system permease protein